MAPIVDLTVVKCDGVSNTPTLAMIINKIFKPDYVRRLYSKIVIETLQLWQLIAANFQTLQLNVKMLAPLK